MRQKHFVVASLLVVALSPSAFAQDVDRQYAEEPTGGIALPLAPLAGEHDARAVSVNPGGLALVRGTELALALDLEDPDVATSSGQGFGAFLATSIGGGLVPRLAVGLGFEWLRPPRQQLRPDPGEPFRFTLGVAGGLGANLGFGASWHHFSTDGLLAGADTFDLGLSSRWGNHLAVGGTIKDLVTRSIGGVPVERRYELEALVRPLATDALELAVGGRLGEDSSDVDGWARISARIARGVLVHLGAETRELHAFATTTSTELHGRDVRAMLGVELSFGRLGTTLIASGLRDDRGESHVAGGQLLVRLSTQGPPSVTGPGDRIERVDLSGTIGVRALTGLVARMRLMAHDPHVKAVVVTFDGADGGWATLEELRNEMLGLRKAGKKVFAYMVSGTGRDYFVASAADKIYVDPAGGLRIVGMAGSSPYFRGAFDWLGVSPQFDRIGEYKSAPEQFTSTGPSDTARQMQNDLFDSLWNRYVNAIAQSRGLTPAEVKTIIDNGPYTAGDLARDTRDTRNLGEARARNGGAKVDQLVDEVAAPERVAQLVVTELGAIYPITSLAPDRPERWERPQVAVIYIDGDIVDGKSRTMPLLGKQMAGSETLVGAIAAARANPAIGAIILRINSPGGSALASELISREVFATRGIKPILCSLGDVAASGGYFIAAGCDTIYADAMSITGSIGIFYGKFDLGGLVKRLGVNIEVYKRGQRSDIESYFRPYTDEERVVLLDKLRYMYSRFIGAVAEGRGLTKEAVDAAGRGHVYTGEQAKVVKLVDKFGGFADVLDDAKQRMKLAPSERVRLVELPAIPTSLLGSVGRLFGVSTQASSASDASILAIPLVRELLQGIPAALLVQPETAMARLPVDFVAP